MKRWGIVTALAALAVLPTAAAHKGAPYWSRAEAERAVLVGPVELGGRTARIDDVSCFGVGRIRLRVMKTLKYQHFDCLVIPTRERRGWIRVHPLPRGGWTYDFLHWA